MKNLQKFFEYLVNLCKTTTYKAKILGKFLLFYL